MPDGGDSSIMSASIKLKDEGNNHFKDGNYEQAVLCYQKCLDQEESWNDERLAVHKNLAASYLKLDNFEAAAQSATKAIEISPQDVKALFRRCQAFENIGKFADAMKDGLKVQHLEPQNSSVTALLRRVNEKMQTAAKEQASTSNRVSTMYKYINDKELEMEKRETAINNLLVLARDNSGADLIIATAGLNLLKQVLANESGKFDQMRLTAIRVLSEICRNSPKRTVELLKAFEGITLLLNVLEKTAIEELVTATQYTIQCMVGALSGYDIKASIKADPKLVAAHEIEIDVIMSTLVKRSSSRIMSDLGRDGILELLMKNTDADVLNWGLKLVQSGGLFNLLEIAGEVEDIKYESSMQITKNTRSHVALALERVYSCMDHDKIREEYRESVMAYINSLLKGPDIESKVRATNIITALLHGPLEIGNYCISQQGIIEMMLVMAGDDDDEVQQRVAAEAIIAAASKKDKCTSIVSMGTGVLKKLYQSENEGIKVRALVGLCKIGSVGGTDASIRPFSDGSIQKLTAACKKFLIDPNCKDLRKWAAEGFAYLTLDADVKEELTDDKEVIAALIDLAKTDGLACLYGVITTLVNLTNSYEKNEVMPEMLELAKFSKQHVPEEHIKDKPEYIDRRRRALASQNVSEALVALSKSESRSARELICRVFNAIVEQQEFRGRVVQTGGAKVLLSMALENNSAPGRLEAAQALARIGITINPEVAFPGQRSAEVVRPLKELLYTECSSIQNFEALMALTNLAQVSDSVAVRILKDGGFSKIEHFMYESHELLRRAATQCVVNLITYPEVVKAFEAENDRVKLLLLLSEDDDLDTAKAAAGGLAMLSSVSVIACEKVFEVKRWYEILMMLTSSKDKELQHRGIVLVRNLIFSTKEVAEKIVETTIFEVLLAITRPEVDDIGANVKALAKECLDKALELSLIKPTSTIDGISEENDDEPD